MDARDARERLMGAAAKLLAQRGAEETSTRAICEAAGVTQPTLYHHFGDKAGLIEAVVTEGFERALARKKASERETGDPLEDLRRGWDEHVSFGVENPHLYAVMHGRPGAGRDKDGIPKAAEEASSMLLSLTRRIARAGRLKVEPELAAQVVWAAVYGVTSMLSARPGFGWHALLSRTVREAVISAITVPEREDRPGIPELAGAEALRLLGLLEAHDGEGDSAELLRGFSGAEAALLKEWIGRIARVAPGVRSEETDENEEARP